MNSVSTASNNGRRAKVVCRACGVCGKPAAGMNYLAISCNGCRTFFRRSIAHNKTYECKGTGDTQHQCFLQYGCKKCRLKLCHSAGMNPHAVQSVEEFNENLNGISDDIQPKSCVPQQQDYRDNLKAVAHPPSQIEHRLDKMIGDLLVIEDAHYRLRISSYCPKMVEGLTVDEFIEGPSKLGFNYGIMCTQSYEPASIQLVPVEMVVKHKMSIDFSNFDYSSKKLWLFQDVVYSMEFMKALPIYHLLDDSSKFALLCSAMVCSNLTAAFFSYSHHSDRTYFPDGGTMSWSAEIQAQSPGTTRLHTNIIAAIREAKLDKREYVLLKMIIVCNPMLDGLTHDDVKLIQREKERWTKTLLSYVLARRGIREGPSMFAKILSVADLVTRLTNWSKSQHILVLAMGLWKHRISFNETIFHSN
ncbi:hypothetical protein PRIPAC_78653 [Pristionchus pacificus]|nr:hypothetical protein PRIPAC_78653 [Pristionchus pacificus]